MYIGIGIYEHLIQENTIKMSKGLIPNYMRVKFSLYG